MRERGGRGSGKAIKRGVVNTPSQDVDSLKNKLLKNKVNKSIFGICDVEIRNVNRSGPIPVKVSKYCWNRLSKKSLIRKAFLDIICLQLQKKTSFFQDWGPDSRLKTKDREEKWT